MPACYLILDTFNCIIKIMSSFVAKKKKPTLLWLYNIKPLISQPSSLSTAVKVVSCVKLAPVRLWFQEPLLLQRIRPYVRYCVSLYCCSRPGFESTIFTSRAWQVKIIYESSCFVSCAVCLLTFIYPVVYIALPTFSIPLSVF